MVVMPQDGSVEPARYRVVWHLSDGGGDVHEHFLRSLTNLLTDLRAEGVQVEVVTQGPGLDLLLKDGVCTAAVGDLQGRGVVFVACENTLRGRQLALDDLLAGVPSVTSAVGHLVRRQAEGWSYLRV